MEPNLGTIQSELKSFIGRQNQKFTELERRLDGIEVNASKPGYNAPAGGEIMGELIRKIHEGKSDFERFQRIRFEVPSPLLAAKTLVSTGITNPAAAGEIGNSGVYGYGAVRALFEAVPVGTAAVFQVREDAATGWNASPQTEASDKNESITTLSGETINVQTIAHWIAVSRQALDDVEGLPAFLGGRLLWGLAAEVENQIVSGSGAGVNLDGLTTQASSFDTGLLTPSDGWDALSILGAAATQCRLAGYRPNFAVMHPSDVYRMRFLRDTTGQFLVAPPSLPPIVESAAITEGTFVLGDSSQAKIRVRMNAVIDVSEQHSDFFVKNKVALRAEERLCLQVLSPKAFITGNLTSSPA